MSYDFIIEAGYGRLGKKRSFALKSLRFMAGKLKVLIEKLEVSSENLEVCWESHMAGKSPKQMEANACQNHQPLWIFRVDPMISLKPRFREPPSTSVTNMVNVPSKLSPSVGKLSEDSLQ
jgi:hypothetical protein